MIGANMISFYISSIIIIGFIVIMGVDETLKWVHYIELRIKTKWIEYRLYRMKQRLKKELDEWKSSH